MSITDPYVASKQKPGYRAYEAGLITAEKVRLEEARLRKVVAPAPADTGKYCHCGKELHRYDVARGECFKHPLARVQAARNGRV